MKTKMKIEENPPKILRTARQFLTLQKFLRTFKISLLIGFAFLGMASMGPGAAMLEKGGDISDEELGRRPSVAMHSPTALGEDKSGECEVGQHPSLDQIYDLEGGTGSGRGRCCCAGMLEDCWHVTSRECRSAIDFCCGPSMLECYGGCLKWTCGIGCCLFCTIGLPVLFGCANSLCF